MTARDTWWVFSSITHVSNQTLGSLSYKESLCPVNCVEASDRCDFTPVEEFVVTFLRLWAICSPCKTQAMQRVERMHLGKVLMLGRWKEERVPVGMFEPLCIHTKILRPVATGPLQAAHHVREVQASCRTICSPAHHSRCGRQGKWALRTLLGPQIAARSTHRYKVQRYILTT